MGCTSSSETSNSEVKLIGPLSVLSPIRLGAVYLPNRVVMAAMTRCRTDPKTGIPNNDMVEYYSSRASAGFILTECAAVSAESNAFPGAGCLYNDE